MSLGRTLILLASTSLLFAGSAAAESTTGQKCPLTGSCPLTETSALPLQGFVLPQLVAAVQPAPTLSVDDVSLSEDSCQHTTFLFTVTLSKLPSKAVTVDYSTSDGSALAGQDYVATSGSLTFTHKTATKGAQGSYLLTVGVPLGNHVVSATSKTFTLTLSGASNATIAKAQGIGTLMDPAASC